MTRDAAAVSCRCASTGDFLAVAALDQEAWKDYPNGAGVVDGEHTWRHWVEHAMCILAESPEGTVGAALAFPCANGTYCLHKVMVAKAWRNAGIGRRMMECLLDHTDRLGLATFLTVSPANTRALTLYRSLGFTGDRLMLNYYRPDENRYEFHRAAQNKQDAA